MASERGTFTPQTWQRTMSSILLSLAVVLGGLLRRPLLFTSHRTSATTMMTNSHLSTIEPVLVRVVDAQQQLLEGEVGPVAIEHLHVG